MIYTFFGADSKVGVTMIADSVAQRIAQISGEPVYLLHLDGHPGTEYSPAPFPGSLADLKPALKSGILSLESLRGYCAHHAGCWELKGERDAAEAEEIPSEDIRRLLDVIPEESFVVIDAGCNLDLEMAREALNYSDQNLLTTTQQQLSLARWAEQVGGKELQKVFDHLVVNKFFSHGPLPDEKKLKQLYKMDDCLTVPYSEYAWQADQEHEVLLAYRDTGFRQGIGQICAVMGFVGDERKHLLKWRRKDGKK